MEIIAAKLSDIRKSGGLPKNILTVRVCTNKKKENFKSSKIKTAKIFQIIFMTYLEIQV